MEKDRIKKKRRKETWTLLNTALKKQKKKRTFLEKIDSA